MATLTRFNGESSGCRTPDPLGVLGSSGWAQKGTDHFEQDSSEDESGSRTPSRVANVNIEALRAKIQELQAERARCFEDTMPSLPPGLTPPVENRLGGNVMKVFMNSNLTQPFSTASSSLPLLCPPPLPCPELRSSRQERKAVGKAKFAQSLMDEQTVSKGSVGHPFHCAEACKYVKRKGGCQQGANCPNCHHCFWSKAHAGMKPKQEAYSGAGQEAHTGMKPKQEARTGAGQEDARLKEAQSLANKLVVLLGGEEPFASKPKESKVAKTELSVGTMGHPHSCAEACKYVRRKGGCMYGDACKNCHACLWSHTSSKKSQGYSSGAGLSSAIAQDSQGSFANPAPVISLNALLPEPRLLPTNPTEELPAHQTSQEGFSWETSVGSMGHPHSCGPACKYALKSKGCKDGRLCSHCHLCRWMRYGVRTGNKQPIQITAWTSL